MATFEDETDQISYRSCLCPRSGKVSPAARLNVSTCIERRLLSKGTRKKQGDLTRVTQVNERLKNDNCLRRC